MDEEKEPFKPRGIHKKIWIPIIIFTVIAVGALLYDHIIGFF